ncbi:MAG: hypothetical protein GY822_28810 [Deltaproteobacteria bacterium]|nr:hypothetical protein [Deltaproteobacteria bacterium]
MTTSNQARAPQPFSVLLSPYAAFDGVVSKSRLWLLLLILGSSMTPAIAFNAHVKSDDAVTLQMKRSGTWQKLDEGQRERVLKSMKVLGPVSALAKRLSFIFLVGTLCWVTLRGFSDAATFLTVLLAVTTACVPLLLRDVLSTLVFLFRDPTTLELEHPLRASLGAFLPDDTNPLKVLLMRLDLFTIWVSGLIGMGVNRASKTKSMLPWIVVVSLWALGTALELFGTL